MNRKRDFVVYTPLLGAGYYWLMLYNDCSMFPHNLLVDISRYLYLTDTVTVKDMIVRIYLNASHFNTIKNKAVRVNMPVITGYGAEIHVILKRTDILHLYF